MALTTSRVQCLAVRATRDCCTVFFGDLARKKSTHNRIRKSGSESSGLNNDFKSTSDAKYPATVKEKQILRLLVNELKVKREVIQNEIMKHPKRKFITVCQIQKSLKFLQHLGYSKQVIADLPAICFYPQGNIETALGEIKKNAVELYKLGYVNGILKGNTPGFRCGSKLKDKRLQLCLYYMELPFDFNGNGIFNIDGWSDLCNSETEK